MAEIHAALAGHATMVPLRSLRPSHVRTEELGMSAIKSARAPVGAILHTVVLAAGASTRFGSPKQLVRFHGRTLLQRESLGLPMSSRPAQSPWCSVRECRRVVTTPLPLAAPVCW